MISLLKNIAQNIAKSSSDVIGYSILVTDEKGIIIGCNEENRLGKFHGPSIRVISDNRPMTTSIKDAEGMKVRPGYTLPIQLLNRTIGSVSIAGLPEDVARYGLLVQKQAEIMLREQALLESNVMRKRALRDLVESLANYDIKNRNEELITIQSRELGYDLNRCKVAVVTKMKKWGKESCESAFQKMMRELGSCFSNPRNVICQHENYHATILFAPSSDCSSEKLISVTKSLSADFLKSISSKGVEADLSIGLPSKDLAGLASSLRAARNALRLGTQFGASGIISAGSFSGEALLDLLPLSKRREFAARTLDGLIGRSDYEEIKETFLAWCESPFASRDVAERLAIHRNSLQYRLKKIRKLTGKNPWSFKDAFELWASFILLNM